MARGTLAGALGYYDRSSRVRWRSAGSLNPAPTTKRPWRIFRLIFREPGDVRKMPPRQGRGREGIRRSGWEDSKHGCLHEFLDTADRDVPKSACAGAAESVEEAAARGSCAVAPVLASHPEHGEPGTAG